MAALQKSIEVEEIPEEPVDEPSDPYIDGPEDAPLPTPPPAGPSLITATKQLQGDISLDASFRHTVTRSSVTSRTTAETSPSPSPYPHQNQVVSPRTPFAPSAKTATLYNSSYRSMSLGAFEISETRSLRTRILEWVTK